MHPALCRPMEPIARRPPAECKPPGHILHYPLTECLFFAAEDIVLTSFCCPSYVRSRAAWSVRVRWRPAELRTALRALVTRANASIACCHGQALLGGTRRFYIRSGINGSRMAAAADMPWKLRTHGVMNSQIPRIKLIQSCQRCQDRPVLMPRLGESDGFA